MLGKIAGALLGKKIAGRNNGLSGALIGAGIAAIARRGLFPLAVTAGAAYAGKKAWDKYNTRKAPAYPSDASDASVSPPSA
ncbi:hypothetical protein H8M03_07920 [Sphingomonas sabuli]|uniref:Uncharacterized protein n=1 Tax=Sphingomonas sabuli TaxID=2764186 RepID=A0A7G9L014_9SPHN|nr:hypothetical protein [Sphingomonas sabuli]QNM81963.1 hypothetical protein H8M03_07920 [Sphingomonas sabuli]